MNHIIGLYSYLMMYVLVVVSTVDASQHHVYLVDPRSMLMTYKLSFDPSLGISLCVLIGHTGRNCL